MTNLIPELCVHLGTAENEAVRLKATNLELQRKMGLIGCPERSATN
jgi:hypothetical protein